MTTAVSGARPRRASGEASAARPPTRVVSMGPGEFLLTGNGGAELVLAYAQGMEVLLEARNVLRVADLVLADPYWWPTTKPIG